MPHQPPLTESRSRRIWTAEDVRALGVATDLPTAGQILGLSRNHTYQLARRGEFPVPVLHVGNRMRVPTAPLLAFLGIEH